ncbi:glycosyltransferase [Flavihumibacter sediminis]|nr:glycosyltransferase [Flavihumibacter sediminis]
MSIPLVSVLMTSHNREKYIESAILSVLGSTFENFELIIVDDCSTDKTVEICKKIEKADSRVKVYINDKNLGDYPNRNKAASYASGKYLKYVDADDLIYPYGLQLLVEMMEANPEAGWGLCSLGQIKDRPYPILLNSEEAYIHHYFGPGLFHKAPLSSIMKKELFEKVKGFTPDRMISDTLMWHRLAMVSPVLLMQDGIVWYREHDQQESSDVRLFDFAYDKITIDSLNDPNNPLAPDKRKSILSVKKKMLTKKLMRGIVKMDTIQIDSAIKSLKYLSQMNNL